MTAIEKVLQRKDGATLVVGVVVALSVLQTLATITQPLSSKILGEDNQQLAGASFANLYGTPLLWFVLQVLALELLVWLVISVRSFAYAKPTKRKK